MPQRKCQNSASKITAAVANVGLIEKITHRAAAHPLTGALAVAAVLGLPAFASATTITAWDFNAIGIASAPFNSPTPSTGSGTAITLGMTNAYNGGNTASDDVLNTAGTANSSFNENTWRIRGASHNGWATHAAGAAQYTQGMELDASTVGFTGVSFAFDWYSTTQGIRDLQFQYNTNTTNSAGWTNFGGTSPTGTYIATSNDFYNAPGSPTITVDLSSITAANNDANFGIRLVSAFDSTGNVPNDYAAAALTGGHTVIYNNNSGNWRFDNLVFSGTGGGGGGGGAPNVTWATTSGNWDTSNTNWTGGTPVANQYTDGDNAIFGNQSGSVTVTISSSVAPASTVVNAGASGAYTFTGGAIGGTGSMAISGGGTVTLSAANTYSGGTLVTGTKLIVDGGDNRLGGSTGILSVGSGSTLQVNSANISSARNIVVAAGGATINTQAFNIVTSGNLTVNDVLNKTGAGNLEIDGKVSVSNAGVLNIMGGNVILNAASDTVNQVNSATYNGNLIVEGGETVAFGGTITGTGAIQVVNGDNLGAGTGVLITNTKGPAHGFIDIPIQLNSTNQAFTGGNVAAATFVPGTFTTTIGGSTAATGFLTVNGVISGNSDVNIANAVGGTGSGTLILGAHNTWNGATTINTNAATLQNAIDNALPTTTDLIVGTESIGLSTWDLNGFSQQISSLSSGAFENPGSPSTSAGFLTITNNSGNNSLLLVSGSVTPATPDTDILTEGANGGTLALEKDGINTLTLEGNADGNDNFTGGIFVGGGTLNLNEVFNPGGVVDSSNNLIIGFLGGTFEVQGKATGTSSQSITGTVNGVSGIFAAHGNDTIFVNDGGGAGTTLTASNLSRNASGGIVFAELTANGTFTINNAPSLQNGIIPWATVNGSDFATMSGNNLVALPMASYTEQLVPLIVSNSAANIRIDAASPSVIDPIAPTVVNSILVNDSGAPHSLVIGSGNTLQLGSAGNIGSLFVTGNTPLFTIDSAGDAGSLTAGSELVLISNSILMSFANITDGSGGSVALTTGGTGVTITAGANTYSGLTEINGGTLQVGDFGTTGNLGTFGSVDDRGTLAFGRSDSVTVGDTVFGPGGISEVGGGTTLVTGANTFTGTVNIAGGTLAVDSVSTPGTVQPLGQGTAPIQLGAAFTHGTLQIFGGSGTINVQFPLVVGGAGGGSVNSSGGSVDLQGPINNNAGDFSLTGGNIIVDGQISGSSSSSSVTVSGGASVTLTNGGNAYTGPTNVTGGSSLTVATTGAIPSGGNVANSGSLNVNANSTLGNVSGTGTTSVPGGVSVTTNGFTQGGLVNNGSVTVNGNGTVGPISGSGALTVGNGTTANTLVLATNSGASTVGALTLLGTSSLDVNNDHLFISYGSPANDPATTIRAYLTSGSNGGHWNGTGLVSSAANVQNTTGGLKYALGYVDSADAGIHPAGLPANTIEVKYTLVGDLDLNGVVNGTDFARLSTNFGHVFRQWDQGDLDYNNVVNGSDFAALSANFGHSDTGAAVALSASDWAAFDAFAADHGLTAIPEPTSLGVLALGGMGLIGRRRRKA